MLTLLKTLNMRINQKLRRAGTNTYWDDVNKIFTSYDKSTTYVELQPNVVAQISKEADIIVEVIYSWNLIKID
jgi:hypothetical protein